MAVDDWALPELPERWALLIWILDFSLAVLDKFSYFWWENLRTRQLQSVKCSPGALCHFLILTDLKDDVFENIGDKNQRFFTRASEIVELALIDIQPIEVDWVQNLDCPQNDIHQIILQCPSFKLFKRSILL